jgi:hypothetical protein
MLLKSRTESSELATLNRESIDPTLPHFRIFGYCKISTDRAGVHPFPGVDHDKP